MSAVEADGSGEPDSIADHVTGQKPVTPTPKHHSTIEDYRQYAADSPEQLESDAMLAKAKAKLGITTSGAVIKTKPDDEGI